MVFQDTNSKNSDDRGASKRDGRLLLGLALAIALVSLVVGLLIGWFAHNPTGFPEASGAFVGISESTKSKLVHDGPVQIRQQIFDGVRPENIEENLRKWTSFPHLAGTEGEHRLAREIEETWEQQGLDRVSSVTYDVLLSFPDDDDPSVVQVFDKVAQTAVHVSKIKERVLEPGQSEDDVVLPYNGYSYPGDVQGYLVYVNYGRLEDFRYLEANNIAVQGCIAIARYGKIFRGDKAKFSEMFGAIGLIMYTDPYDYSEVDTPPYPDSWWLPDTGVQRGTIFASRGDPLTPGYPARDYAYRMNANDTEIPKIPVHPISFGDAWALLSRMQGSVAPPDWQGSLNISYRHGPGFNDANLVTRLKVTTITRRANTTNVFGFINGSVEPDRYVLLGNHYDSWVLGAVDPTSGTATMMELSRVLAKLVKEGWRPRRSIIFCAWGAEEFGLVGSFEWTEEFVNILQDRAVVYLNVDMSTAGNDSLRALGVPMIYDALYTAAKQVPTPRAKGRTLYDEWIKTFPELDQHGNRTGKPKINNLGAGSDYAGFQAFSGISSADFRYQYGPQYKVSSYPLYHSAYETFNLMKKYIDPEFKYSAAVAKYWGELARYFADSYVIPFNVSRYPDVLDVLVEDLDNGYGSMMSSHGIEMGHLRTAVAEFRQECSAFQTRLENADYANPIEIKTYNDQQMMVERAFIDPVGLPSRAIYRHVIFAPSMYNSYAGAAFPGLVDLMFEIETVPDPEEQWEKVKKHFSTVVFAIHTAASVLKDPTRFT